MAQYRRHHVLLRHVALLLIFPLGVASVAYAIFSQDLSLDAAGSSVAYVSNQSLMMTYTKTQTGSAPYTYTTAMTLKNNATKNTTVWQIDLTVPTDISAVTCPATVFCTLAGTKLTILSNTNGAITRNGGTLAVSFSFQTATNAYTFQSVDTYANYAASYATIAGLTVNTSVGARTGVSGAYTWPVTFTITNNSLRPLIAWRVVMRPWASTYVVSGLPTGVTSTGTTTRTFTGSNELAKGAVYQFTWSANTKTNGTWAITSAVITGDS